MKISPSMPTLFSLEQSFKLYSGHAPVLRSIRVGRRQMFLSFTEQVISPPGSVHDKRWMTFLNWKQVSFTVRLQH